MSFNLSSKINNLLAEQDEVQAQLDYLTSLAPAELSNLKAIANSINNDPAFYQTVASALALKADQITTYTKTAVDASLAFKANQATTYTKTETDQRSPSRFGHEF